MAKTGNTHGADDADGVDTMILSGSQTGDAERSDERLILPGRAHYAAIKLNGWTREAEEVMLRQQRCNGIKEFGLCGKRGT